MTTATAHRARIMRATARQDDAAAYAHTLAAEADGYAVRVRPTRRGTWTVAVTAARVQPARSVLADLRAEATR